MNLPTEQQCLQYFEQYKVPMNIREHCLNVCVVAVFLAARLKEAGEPVNIELVKCTALLHDLFKMVMITSLKSDKYHQRVFSAEELAMRKQLRKQYPGLNEGEIAHLLFKDVYPELAVVIRNVGVPKKKDRTLEEAIVHYADWRVLRNKIVTLKERLDYLKEVYPREAKDWEEDESIILDFEHKIAKLIGARLLEHLAEKVNIY